MHACMERLLQSPGFALLDEAQARERMRVVFENVLSGELAPLAADSRENTVQLKEVRRAALRASVLLNRQLKKSGFKQEALELRFTDRLKAGDKEHPLHGQIDRVDKGMINNRSYVFVVDYKSGNTKLDPPSMYEGLQLQLMTYLAVAQRDYSRRAGKGAERGRAYGTGHSFIRRRAGPDRPAVRGKRVRRHGGQAARRGQDQVHAAGKGINAYYPYRCQKAFTA